MAKCCYEKYVYCAHFITILLKLICNYKNDYAFLKVKEKNEKEVERLEQLLQDTEDKQRQVNSSNIIPTKNVLSIVLNLISIPIGL